MNFNEELSNRAREAEEVLKSFLPKETGKQEKLIQAANYAALGGGKRLRPVFMMASYEMFHEKDEKIYPFMAALEMIHTYSLVHDDLPAMDDDDYRRGRKTTHLVYGEAFGILAGDALLNLAFETAAGAFSQADTLEDYARIAKALQILGQKSGIYGMVGGQSVDVDYEGKEIDFETLQFIYHLKTGALIEAALMIGAVLGGADDEDVRRMEQIAQKTGMAFQIQDDVLDMTGTAEELGKPIGSDEKNKKMTYAVFAGLEKAMEKQEELSGEAEAMLEDIHTEGSAAADAKGFLVQLIQNLTKRTN